MTNRPNQDSAAEHSTFLASVVIPVHNAADTLPAQLAALADQQFAEPFEVVVVLNRCTDDSADVARRFSASLHLRLVEANDKPSAAYARNAGAAVSLAGLILFCDADDRVGASWVSDMVEALQRADFVGGKVNVERSGLADWAYERFYRNLDGSCLFVHNNRILYPISASLGCRREAYDSIGGFDESFVGAGGEEVDLAIRLFRAGFRVGEAPTAELCYEPRRTFRSLMRQRRGYAGASAQLALRAGVPPPRPNDLTGLCRTPRVLASRFLRGRQRNIRALSSEALTRYYVYSAARSAARTGSDMRYEGPAGAVDFVVPLEAGTIGGRSLMARDAEARGHANERAETTTLALVERLLRAGDTVVDLGADIGLYTLCAALRVGTTGSVLSLEPDEGARELLAENLKRHGVDARVHVVPAGFGGLLDPTSPIDLIRIDLNRFELDISSDTEQLLHASRAVILIETRDSTSRRDSHGGPPADLASLLLREDRAVWRLDRGPSGSPLRVRRLIDLEAAATADMTDCARLLVGPLEREHELEVAIEEVLGSGSPEN